MGDSEAESVPETDFIEEPDPPRSETETAVIPKLEEIEEEISETVPENKESVRLERQAVEAATLEDYFASLEDNNRFNSLALLYSVFFFRKIFCSASFQFRHLRQML